MSNFTVDSVPTPQIDLARAFESDLKYYSEYRKMPPLGRSQMEQMGERLNQYLKYVNESFIQKGFSSSSPSPAAASDTGLYQWSNEDAFTVSTAFIDGAKLTIKPTVKADLVMNWTIYGYHTPAAGGTVGDVLTVELWVDGTKNREWQQTLVTGPNTLSCGVCVGGRAIGTHTLLLKMKLSNGTFAVDAGNHYAYGYGKIVR